MYFIWTLTGIYVQYEHKIFDQYKKVKSSSDEGPRTNTIPLAIHLKKMDLKKILWNTYYFVDFGFYVLIKRFNGHKEIQVD